MKKPDTEQMIKSTELEAQPALRQALSNLNETFMKSLRYLCLPSHVCGKFRLERMNWYWKELKEGHNYHSFIRLELWQFLRDLPFRDITTYREAIQRSEG